MPVSKKRKIEKKKRRDHEPSGAPVAPPGEQPSGGSGFLGKMRGGFQAVAGGGPKKPESLWSKILTWALVVAVAWFVAKRFGLLP